MNNLEDEIKKTLDDSRKDIVKNITHELSFRTNYIVQNQAKDILEKEIKEFLEKELVPEIKKALRANQKIIIEEIEKSHVEMYYNILKRINKPVGWIPILDIEKGDK